MFEYDADVEDNAYEALVELFAYDAVKAYEALVDVVAYDADVEDKAYEALVDVVAYEALTELLAYDDVIEFCAHDAVPNKLPVIPCVTVNVPFSVETPLEDTIKISEEPLCTTNKAPVKLSVMVNNPPCDPLISKTIEPELYRLVEPVTLNDPVIRADPV